MKQILLLAVGASLAFAQTAPKLPTWAGSGGEYTGAASPHWSGWGAFATPVSTSLGAYSFTLEQAILQGGKIVTVLTTGIDDILKTLSLKTGEWTLHAIASIGGASTPTASVGALANGGGLMYRFKEKLGIIPAGFTFEAFVLETKAGAPAKPSVLIGGGWTW